MYFVIMSPFDSILIISDAPTGDTIVFQRGEVARSKIMMALETEKQNLGIISWRFQETSLEDVFGNRIRHADDLDAIALD
jgi:hypothetical protein